MDFLGIFISVLCILSDVTYGYLIGVGRADVTGPIAEVTLMGYGKFGQKGSGLHLRQFSRAYIVSDGQNRLVFVNVDVGMMADGVRIQAIKILEEKFGGLYNMDNVMISGTHTHSGVGGFMMHTFFDIPSGGFCRETFEALVTGIVKSIEKAHSNLQEGVLRIATDTILNVSVNRSPTSYLENPKEERAKYVHDTDKELVQVRFVNKKGKLIGVINWYAIHGTTLNNTNTLVSSDNIGLASVVLENYMQSDQDDFVGSFASSNLGDVSPNVQGPKCHKSGTECDAYSKCADMFEECYALGPENDMYESVKNIGFRLANAANVCYIINIMNLSSLTDLLFSSDGVEIKGPVRAIHQYVDMPKAIATIFNRATKTVEQVRGCLPAMGYSAGAGTTDGPFLPFLRQGMKSTVWWVDAMTHFVAKPTKEDVACHAPKPILLASGHMGFPFEWQPRIVSTQLGRIGNVAIVCVPGEFTTMAGRRMRKAIKEVWGADTKVVIAGLCNTYSDYITTYEEYQAQRYEAASTLFGPHTLSLHLSQYKNLARALSQNETLGRGPEPKGLDPDKMVSFIPPVLYDAPKKSHKFGDVLVQPEDVSHALATARATFVAANPRNNLRLDDTYVLVECKTETGHWIPVADDASVSTTLRWRRTNVMKGTSEVDIEWTPAFSTFPGDVGTCRIRYFGDSKSKGGKIRPFEGVTNEFKAWFLCYSKKSGQCLPNFGQKNQQRRIRKF